MLLYFRNIYTVPCDLGAVGSDLDVFEQYPVLIFQCLEHGAAIVQTTGPPW